jgi:aminomethyltransferase
MREGRKPHHQTMSEEDRMTEEERRSPLHDAQVAAGAEFIWEDGWPWAMTVSAGALAEYEAIRSATGLWDLYSTCKYEVSGHDAGRLIQRRFTNNVSAMASGQVRYGAFVNGDGLMVDDGNVYKHSDEKFWAMINTADLEGWFRETAVGLEAKIEHVTERLPMISVQGPTSRDFLLNLTSAPLADLGYFRFWPDPVEVAGVSTTVLRTGFSGELGFELVADPGSVPSLWGALVGAGGVPFGLEAIEIARIEAGLIIIGMDYQPGATSPYDMSLDRFIKPATECVGVEALAQVGGNPPRRLKTLSFASETGPEAGSPVVKDGEQVGTVTSPIVSPRLGAIGLAVLRADAAIEGEKVEVGGSVAAVGPLSLFDPQKTRPRG